MTGPATDEPRWTVYALKRDDDGTPYFVGGTSRELAARMCEHRRSGRSPWPSSTQQVGRSRRWPRLGRFQPGGPSASAMDEEHFWGLIEQSRTPAHLHAELWTLPDEDFVAFEQRHDAAFHGSYDWGLWGAAYVIDHGCSDDNFDYFRAYLISLGRRVFEAALADPESLVEVEIVVSAAIWESWMSPTMSVIHARSGRYEFATELDPRFRMPRTPTGREWPEDQAATFFPRLAAKYGWQTH